MELDIPTAVPLVYELDENLKPIRHYYLRKQASSLSFLADYLHYNTTPVSKEELEKRMQAVKNQGKAAAVVP